MRAVFCQFDRNGNGRVEKQELMDTFKELGKYFSPNKIDNMMKQADKDKSGDLDYEEFIAHYYGKQMT